MKLLIALLWLASLSNGSSAVVASSPWTVAQSKHFEVYSEMGASSARAALAWFEQLRAFFVGAGFDLDDQIRIRVIGFRSAAEYNNYRLKPAADAYYLGTQSRHYIVMPSLGADEFGIAAHEYAHFVLHTTGMQFPPWLNEGLAEFFSTIHFSSNGGHIGGDLPLRSQTLRSHPWFPLPQLLQLAPGDQARNKRGGDNGMFYAQSWAIVNMLMLSPEYQPHFQTFIALLNAGTPSAEALTQAYKKSLNAIGADLRGWVGSFRAATTILLPAMVAEKTPGEATSVSSFDSRALLADLVMASGDLGRAESMYRALEREFPDHAEVEAALGAIALRSNREFARTHWKRAIELGITDAVLCYQYAVLAEDAGLPPAEIRLALERAIALKPDFDNAHYQLALLNSNSGQYEDALQQFRAMQNVPLDRAYGYWTAMSYDLTELKQRDEAKMAAQNALNHAATNEERNQAKRLAYIADTDLAVQFTHDASGHLQAVTTRVPHGQTGHNPFIEPDDNLHHVKAQLREVACSGGQATGVVVETPAGSLSLSIPDPTHVIMRKAPAEFSCGPQQPTEVTVDYAAMQSVNGGADGVLRGMTFSSDQ